MSTPEEIVEQVSDAIVDGVSFGLSVRGPSVFDEGRQASMVVLPGRPLNALHVPGEERARWRIVLTAREDASVRVDVEHPHEVQPGTWTSWVGSTFVDAEAASSAAVRWARLEAERTEDEEWL